MPSVRERALWCCGLVIAVGGCTQRQSPASPSPERATEQPSSAAATVRSDKLAREPGKPIESVLEGRVAGVVIARTSDGSISVRIRGASSLYGNNEPLYVLDGLPIQPGPNGSLTGINPHDIESIKVLKDPTDTAMYGARGANGVIVIKTKQPPKPNQ